MTFFSGFNANSQWHKPFNSGLKACHSFNGIAWDLIGGFLFPLARNLSNNSML
jgi:hypothetical protein